MKPLELQLSIRKKALSPLYFFYGDEIFLIDKMVAEMKARVIAPHLSDFNLNVFYGGESEPQDIINAAKTLPLMSEYRLVIVKEADQLGSSSLEALSSYFSRPLPSTCLILCAEKMVLSSKLLTVFKRNGKVVRFYHPYDHEMPEWIRRVAKECDKRISPHAVALLTAELERDLQKMYGEVLKLASYVGERGVIEGDDVKEVLADVKSGSVFDLVDHIARKDLEGALNALKRLVEAGEPPLKILTMITRQGRLAARAKEMLKKGASSGEVGEKLGIRDFYLKGFLAQVDTFSLSQVEAYFSCLFHADWKLKSSGVDKRIILERLILDLCGL